MNKKELILQGTIDVFNQKGLKFTMDDLAKRLSMSKKTLYAVFDSKQALFMEMVDYLFSSIKESERQVVEDPSLTTVEKLQKILGVMPDNYKNIDFRQLYSLKDKYPEIYKRVEERLETGWETTIHLMEEGMKEGSVRQTNILLVKTMFEATLEQFFQRDILIQCNMTYQEALEESVRIIMSGIIADD